jgi:hypothetical protein
MQFVAHLLPYLEGDSSDSLATKHQTDVGALSSRVMLQPVSIPLQDGFRFFRHLKPALSQRALRFRLPSRQRYGVSVFRALD